VADRHLTSGCLRRFLAGRYRFLPDPSAGFGIPVVHFFRNPAKKRQKDRADLRLPPLTKVCSNPA
jgi:hypothetical protein